MDGSPLRSWRTAVACLAAAALALGVYLPSLGNGFVSWDDPENFLTNPWYRGLGLPNLYWMFTHFWMGHYHPLTWVTLGLDYTLWGMKPAGYHFTSALLHAASTGIFALLAARLFLLARGPGRSAGAAGTLRNDPAPRARWVEADRNAALLFGVAAGLFWGVHPLRVEAVSWVTERREVLCGLFTLLALENAVRGGNPAMRYALALAALLSKVTAITLPALFVLVDLYREQGLDPGRTREVLLRSLRRHAPLLLVAAGFTVVAFRAQEATSARVSWEWLHLSERLTTYGHQLGFYVQKTLWPAALAPLYEGPHDWVVGAPGPAGRTNPVTELVPGALLAGLVVLAALGAAWHVRRRRPEALLLLLAYLGLTIPTGGFGQSGPQVAADRYTYQSGWVLTLLVAGGAWWLWSRIAGRGGWPRWIVAGALAAGLAGCAVATVGQEAAWRDSWSLWRHTLKYYPDTARAHHNLGLLYTEQVPPDDREAEPHFRAAVRKIPGFSDCLDALGELLVRQGKPEEALQCYEQALRGTPGHKNTLFRLPNLLWDMDRHEEALRYARELVAVDPGNPLAHWKLARALAAGGRPKEAVAAYDSALARFPTNPSMRTDLAWLLATSPDSTVRDGARAVELARSNIAAHTPDMRMRFALVAALAEVGDYDQAQRELEEFLPRAPEESRGPIRNFMEQMKRHEPVRAAPPPLP